MATGISKLTPQSSPYLQFQAFWWVFEIALHTRHALLGCNFCFMQLKQHWNKKIIDKYTYKSNFRRLIFWNYLFWLPARTGGAKSNFFYLVIWTKFESMNKRVGVFSLAIMFCIICWDNILIVCLTTLRLRYVIKNRVLVEHFQFWNVLIFIPN